MTDLLVRGWVPTQTTPPQRQRKLKRLGQISSAVTLGWFADKTAMWVARAAAVMSIVSFAWFDHKGQILMYRDAVAHMEIARRVIDSPTTGFGQLGGVWLPLPHLLMLPFIWINPLYYNGFAGSIISMAAYVVASVLVYKITFDLTGKKAASVCGAGMFMLCANVLYMQSTPMTELLLFACMLGMVYGVQRWIRTESNTHLFGAAVAAFLGSLSRYEAWVLWLTLIAIIVWVSWRKGYGYSKTEGVSLAFIFVGGVGIVSWGVWNQIIFGNALNWQNGNYAKPSLWVKTTELSVGHWSTAFKTYWYAMVDDLSLPIVVLMLVGLAVFVVRERLRMYTLPVLSLLVMFPFFVLALEKGQRPMHVEQLNHNLYNVRFGLLMILPAAILIGYLAAQIRFAPWVAAGIAAVILAVAILSSSVATEKDPQATLYDGYLKSEALTGKWLETHYHGGKILAESFGNEKLLFTAHINLVNNVYEGSYRLWQPALRNPLRQGITWIIMRKAANNTGKPDEVYADLHSSTALESYRRVYDDTDYYVYEVK